MIRVQLRQRETHREGAKGAQGVRVADWPIGKGRGTAVLVGIQALKGSTVHTAVASLIIL